MATIASARAKLAAKVPFMADNYNRSMGEFFGVSSAAIAASPPGMAYASKIRPGVEMTWETNLRRAFNV